MLISSVLLGKTSTPFSGPGNQKLIAGDLSAGFFGEVPASELVTGSVLSTLTGYTRGGLINNDTPWLKFVHEGKILFIPKKCIREYCNWDSLNAVGCVYGKTVTIGDNRYLVRLIRAGNADPASSPGGEWVDLMYRVSDQDPTGTFWARYTDVELGMDLYTQDRGTVCMETTTVGLSYCLSTGNGRGDGLTRFIYNTPKNYSSIYAAWRPVLELI